MNGGKVTEGSNCLFIYHGNCFDGFTSAYLFNLIKPARFHPAFYGQAPPVVDGTELWIVDFSYPRDVMKNLALRAKSMIVLDHHKTAKENLVGLQEELEMSGLPAKVVFDMNHSGAGLLYEYIAKMMSPLVNFENWHGKWFVDVVEDRDLWRMSLPYTIPVMAWIAAHPFAFESYEQIINSGLDTAIEAGKHVQQYINQYGEKAREQNKIECVGGFPVPTMNLPYMNCSEHVGKLCEQFPAYPFAAGYFRRSDGRWQFSLRSRGEFDVSEVAKRFNGGGHRNAAGFDVANLSVVFDE